MTNADSKTDEAFVQAFFERTVVGTIRFCGQCAYMFLFLGSRPSSLAKAIDTKDRRLAPPLSFLTVGLFIQGVVLEISTAIDDTSEVFSQEFYQAYGDLSLWSASLRTFPGLLVVVMIGVALSFAARVRQRFDQNIVISTICYVIGLHSIAVGALKLSIIVLNAMYGDDLGSVIGFKMSQRLMIGAAVMTSVYGVAAISIALRSSSERLWIRKPVIHYPIGAATTLLLLMVVYNATLISFNVSQAESRRHDRLVRSYGQGFRVSVIEQQPSRDSRTDRTYLQMTMAITNVSEHNILVPRVDAFETSDKEAHVPIINSSLAALDDPAIVLLPNQTRVIQLRLDTTPLQPRLVRGEVTAGLIVPFHQATNGYSYNDGVYHLRIDVPNIVAPTPGIRLPAGTVIGERPADRFGTF